MSFKTVQLKNETMSLLDVAKEVMVTHHPSLKDVRISNDKIIRHVLNYYIEA